MPILKEFLAGANHAIEAACFGIAGPIVEGRVKTTNLPWIVDSNELRRVLKLDSVNLLNDLEAAPTASSRSKKKNSSRLTKANCAMPATRR